ncbi:MAG: response regulator transcription factor [Chitinophagales bacterium]|nr:response regulator transcription factor [Chitinophagales bacterium]
MCTTIITADENKIFRLGLRHLLEDNSDIEVIAEVSNGEELLNALEYKVPDIVLLDLNISKVNGLQALARIATRNRTKKTGIKTIVLTAHDSESFIIEALEEGACSFLSKKTDTGEIVTAIENVAVTGTYYNERVNKAMVRRLSKTKKIKAVFDDQGTSLSEPEMKVLKLLSREMTSTEIARQLYLSARTVEAIRYQLLKKANAKNVVGLVLWAAKNELISLD